MADYNAEELALPTNLTSMSQFSVSHSAEELALPTNITSMSQFSVSHSAEQLVPNSSGGSTGLPASQINTLNTGLNG
jgi:hypothetical protein